jgi:hypothetical protein
MLPTRARICLSLFVLLATPAMAQEGDDGGAGRTPAPANAKVFFLNVRDGATIPTKFKLRFGVSNMEIAPAGTPKANGGHHHLLIDTQDPALDRPIPADLNHLHFGKGQTEAEVVLAPGEHTLQLVLGDHDHVPHNPPVKSAVIHVRVTSGPVNKSRSEAPSNAEAFFVGLADGATLPPKSVVKFGLKGMEISPAGTDKPLSGHHHLIIDAPAPALDREIPSDLNHLHFGKGQTEAEVTLTPGEHTLQLVLGDYEHVPHDPPVMSKPLHVRVVEARPKSLTGNMARTAAPSGRKPSPPDAEVYFIYPHDGEEIYANSTIRFGLKNMGVAPAGVNKEGTGHHHLLVDADPPPAGTPIPNDLNAIHLGGGQTEKKITLTRGEHTLQLVFADDEHVSFDPPVMSRKIKVYVTRGKLSRDRVAYGRRRDRD